MPWNPNKHLLQMQLEPALYEILKTIADREERSTSQQAVFFIKQGIAAAVPPDRQTQERPMGRATTGGKPANKENHS